MRLSRQVVIVDELPRPGEQALVLDTANGLSAAKTTILRPTASLVLPSTRTSMRWLQEFTLPDRT
jgi:hypothetical protein